MRKKSYKLTSCALMAAILCVIGPLSIPIGAVPVSLATFIIYLSAYVLGSKGASVSVLVYILLGIAGLPVFSGGQGGPAKILGPTGGYIAGYILLAFVSGFVIERFRNKLVASFIGMVLATAVLYTFGTVWFVIQAHTSLAYALSVCVVPFVAFDIIKIIIAESVGSPVRSALLKSGLLAEEKKN